MLHGGRALKLVKAGSSEGRALNGAAVATIAVAAFGGGSEGVHVCTGGGAGYSGAKSAATGDAKGATGDAKGATGDATAAVDDGAFGGTGCGCHAGAIAGASSPPEPCSA